MTCLFCGKTWPVKEMGRIAEWMKPYFRKFDLALRLMGAGYSKFACPDCLRAAKVEE